MCGRFTLSLSPAELQEFFDLFRVVDFAHRYNIAPTQSVVTIRADADGRSYGDFQRWGLIPPWADDPGVGSKMINCRSESAFAKPAFRRAFQEQRCLVPVSGFYEWQAAGKAKQPWYLTLKSGDPAAFAGLWELWNGPDQKPIETFTILTTTANDFMGEVHDRMPIALAREVWPAWLDPSMTEVDVVQSLLVPSLEEWRRVPVSSLVNNVRHDTPDCVKPVRAQRGLFDD